MKLITMAGVLRVIFAPHLLIIWLILWIINWCLERVISPFVLWIMYSKIQLALHKIVNFSGNLEHNSNWKRCEDACTSMAKFFATELDRDEVLATIRPHQQPFLDGIVKVICSLRTTTSASGCALATQLAVTLGPSFDHHYVLTLLPALFDQCRTKKTIAHKQGDAVIQTFLHHGATLNHHIIRTFAQALEDKAIEQRRYASCWLQIVLEKYLHLCSQPETLDAIDRAIRRGLADSQPGVRETMRSTYWTFARLFPGRAESIMSSLHGTHSKLLQAENPNPETIAVSSASAPKQVASSIPPKSHPRSSKPSLKEQIAAQRRLKKAAQTAALDEAENLNSVPKEAVPAVRRQHQATHVIAMDEGETSKPNTKDHASATRRQHPTTHVTAVDEGETSKPSSKELAATTRRQHQATHVTATEETDNSKTNSKEVNPPSRRQHQTAPVAATEGPEALPNLSSAPARRPRAAISAPNKFKTSRSASETQGGSQTMIPNPIISISNATAPTSVNRHLPTVPAPTTLPRATTPALVAFPAATPLAPSNDPVATTSTLINGPVTTLPAPVSLPVATPSPPMSDPVATLPALINVPTTTIPAPVGLPAGTAPAPVNFHFAPAAAPINPPAAAVPPPFNPNIAAIPAPVFPVPAAMHDRRHSTRLNENVVSINNTWHNHEIAEKRLSISPRSRDPVEARRLLDELIRRTVNQTCDDHDYRKMQGLILYHDQIFQDESRFETLLQALLSVFERPMVEPRRALGRRYDNRFQILVTIRAMFEHSRKYFTGYYPQVMRTLLVARRNFESTHHIVSGIEETAQDIVRVCDPTTVIDTALDALETEERDARGTRTIAMGLHVLTGLSVRMRSLSTAFDIEQEKRMGHFAFSCLRESNSPVRRAVIEYCLELRNIIRPDPRFFSLVADNEDDLKNLLTYYIASRTGALTGATVLTTGTATT